MRKTVVYIVAVLLFFGIMAADWNYAEAASQNEVNKKISKLEKDKAELKDKQESVSGEKNETEEKIDENLEKQDTVKSDINTIDQKLSATKSEIQTKENEIATTNEEIEELNSKIETLKSEIKELQERIKKREALLKDRLRAIQQNGGSMKYIEVIFGAQSFGEFISRTSAVNTIMDQDKTILQEQAADKQALEDKKAEVVKSKEEVEKKKASLESQKRDLVALQSQLDNQMAEKEKMMGQLQGEQQYLEEYKMSLEEQERVLNAQAAVIEKAKQAALQEKNQLNQLGESKGSGSSGGNLSAGGSGIFSWPTSGTFTSGFGPRPAPYGDHKGIDIAAPAGTPVSAAASGVVTRSEYSSSYGNVVYVYHPQYNKTTVYAHMLSRSVSLEQQVGAGARVGAVGNTGDSYGNHLHFEVHNGLWSYNGGVNPMPFLK